MKKFTGFPAKMQFIPLPAVFFSTLLSQISNMAELKVTLYIFAALYRKKGYPRCVSRRELEGKDTLMQCLSGNAEPPTEILRQALDMAVKRGTILHLAMEGDGIIDDLYFLNTDSDRHAIARIKSGDISPGCLQTRVSDDIPVTERPDIFTLYEENIGMLTPLVAEDLVEAEKLYPGGWINDAIKEAVALNKRNWRYVSRILERWQQEGRNNGTSGQDSEKKGADRYVKQKYGHLFRR
jgi:DNA replication protein